MPISSTVKAVPRPGIRDVFDRALAVVPGEAFGEEGRGFVRLSYAGDADELREGLRRLRSFAEQI